MSRKVKKYTNEFKEEAVQFALKSPSVLKIAAELGIPDPTLNRSIKQIGSPPSKANGWQPH
jgi:transposase-like protein